MFVVSFQQRGITLYNTEFIYQLERDIYRDSVKLDSCEVENKRKSEIKEQLDHWTSIRDSIPDDMIMCKEVLASANAISADFRERRINFLEKEIEKNLAFLLPDENFKIKIDFKVRDKEQYAELFIGRDYDNLESPRGINGRFVRQLISFTILYSVNTITDCKVLFCDEALSSADPNSLSELKPLIDELIANKFQILMIEHKKEIYDHINRKEITLLKNRIEGYVKIDKEELINDTEEL